VPAHVTILYPFVEPGRFPEHLGRLRSVVGAFEPFAFTLAEVRSFGEEVVYLSVEPERPFLELTDAIVAAWPEYQPYGGAILEPIPHMTIAVGASVVDAESVRNAARSLLPSSAVAQELWVMVGTAEPPVWEVGHVIALGGPPPAP
jgi:2'-5' RNA ligase